MIDYAILMLPAANAVYGRAASRLALAELGVLNAAALGGSLHDAREEAIAGISYLRFTAEAFDQRAVALLSNLSSMFALFELRGEALFPIAAMPRAFFNSDLITIQKYPGKTNPAFTKLLLNVTLFSTAFAAQMPGRAMSILDPLCGRGTTLNQALMYGYDSAGIEIDDKDFEAYTNFLAGWLKDNRVKHAISTARPKAGRRMTAEIGLSKEDYKAGRTVRLEVVNADTLTASTQFKAASFDAIVADLPYGVLHASRSPRDGTSRRPAELCAEALPEWIKLLRPGGAIGLSWNTHVMGRDKFRQLVKEAGIRVLEGGPYGEFRHEVDQSITRDLVVAVKE